MSLPQAGKCEKTLADPFRSKYLPQNYDPSAPPTSTSQRVRFCESIHAIPDAFMVHCLRNIYNRCIEDTTTKKAGRGIAHIFATTFDWLQHELTLIRARFWAGDTLTTADTMGTFSMQSILGKEQAPKERSWERVNQWLKNVESQQAHQRAVATTHHKLLYKDITISWAELIKQSSY